MLKDIITDKEYTYLLIKNINVDNFEIFLDNTIKKFNCIINHIEYVSNYDEFIKYDYEPFSTCGFHIDIEILGGENELRTIAKLYENRIKNINLINKCNEL